MHGRVCINTTDVCLPSPQVHIEFTEGEDKIKVEGPPEEVEQAVKSLENYVRDLVCIYTS